MNKLNYEILSAIDNIDNTIMESEMNVMNSLINSYDKAVMILEYCDDNVDTSSFDIFQEGIGHTIGTAVDKLDEKMKAKPNENIIKKILLFIPRAIMKLIQTLRTKYNEKKLDKAAKDLSNIVDEIDEVIDLDGLFDVDDDESDVQQEAFTLPFTKTKTKQQEKPNNRDFKYEVVESEHDKKENLINDIENVGHAFKDKDPNAKSKLKNMIVNLVKYCSKNNTTMDELSSLIQSFTKFIKKSITLLNDNIVDKMYKGLSDEDFEAINGPMMHLDSEITPLIVKLRDIGNRGNSNVGKIDKGEIITSGETAVEYLADMNAKQILKYTVNILTGLAINVRELIASSNQLMLMCQNLLKEYEKSYDEILQNVDNRTAPFMKIISIQQKMIVDINKELNGEGQSSILQVVSMINQINKLM